MQYPPEKGAAASRIAKMARGLCDRGVTVEVVTALPNYPTGRVFPEYRSKFAVSEVIDSIPVRRYWLYPSNSSAVLKRILNMFSFSITVFCALPHLLRNRSGIFIINSPPLPLALSGLIAARIVRAFAITNLSDIWPMTALELGAVRKGLFYSLLERMESYIYRRADAVITQSNETHDHVLKRCPDKKVFLYRNLDYVSEHMDMYPAIEGQTTKIVYAGLLGVAQSVYEICRSISFRDLGAEFHLYGEGNEKEKIEEFIDQNPNCGIYMHPPVSKAEMPGVLTRYHATIVPLKTRITGAFPSKIYMAMSASLPVLYCGSGESADFVRDNGIGWVAGPSDYSGLARHIRILSAMHERDYRALRERIKSLAVSKYDLAEQLDRLAEFIESVQSSREP